MILFVPNEETPKRSCNNNKHYLKLFGLSFSHNAIFPELFLSKLSFFFVMRYSSLLLTSTFSGDEFQYHLVKLNKTYISYAL